MATLGFDSTDLAATEEFLSSAYTPMQSGARAESTCAQVSREAAGTLSIDPSAVLINRARPGASMPAASAVIIGRRMRVRCPGQPETPDCTSTLAGSSRRIGSPTPTG